MIRDTEENSGFRPVSPMDGIALPTGDGDGDGDDNSGGGLGCDNDNWDDFILVRKKLRKETDKLERQQRVGYTIDLSVNLVNLSCLSGLQCVDRADAGPWTELVFCHPQRGRSQT